MVVVMVILLMALLRGCSVTRGRRSAAGAGAALCHSMA